ncbi:membrane protein [Thermosipho melanesiensis]|uniref:Outer membrane chaperone Skp (OmpH) n=2 Tax=Thermosipho melanesiensis TaxID=46541 RepID=A6LL99_THEM4|nr:OmpH family outer membrane protein [Thermosipho melanesiensis]ABR30700.1 outer membrane chaperone Skp (OmpH) [Thermosipho melanesiensis BI429]APT73830.1 membrane protein [Thermosipho melanesiensis]OOC35769.1 membrane protein [Thermosipho melanesiensis]OOC39068.1 membrane protein [Thermosipho melanesiensis]OOC39216.1 membrane protein [Thermosipho melanesiensis]
MRKVGVLVVSIGILLSFVLLFASGDTNQGPKFAYIDSTKVLQSYSKFITLQAKYQEDAAFYQKKLNELAAEINSMKEQGVSEQEINKKIAEYSQKQQQYSQMLNNEYQPKFSQIEQEILEKIAQYAEIMGYDFVFNSKSMAYGNSKYDITAQFIEYLNSAQ